MPRQGARSRRSASGARAGAAEEAARWADVPLGTVIATRRLREGGRPSRRVEVRLGRPVPIRGRHQAWACPYQIRGVGDARVRRAVGEDALQALELAFLAIRADLVATGRRLYWLDEREVGLGIARHVPWALGPEVEDRAWRAAEREVARATAQLERRARNGQRPRARPRPERSG